MIRFSSIPCIGLMLNFSHNILEKSLNEMGKKKFNTYFSIYHKLKYLLNYEKKVCIYLSRCWGVKYNSILMEIFLLLKIKKAQT